MSWRAQATAGDPLVPRALAAVLANHKVRVHDLRAAFRGEMGRDESPTIKFMAKKIWWKGISNIQTKMLFQRALNERVPASTIPSACQTTSWRPHMPMRRPSSLRRPRRPPLRGGPMCKCNHKWGDKNRVTYIFRNVFKNNRWYSTRKRVLSVWWE